MLLAAPAFAVEPLNVLIITVDDMSADSLAAFGCKLADTSPNIDQLARESMRFNLAHVQVANCMPSRNVLFSGRYPHNNRIEGFYQVKNPGYPVMVDVMKSAGYFTAIRGKVGHSTPYTPYGWDLVLDRLPSSERAHPKNVASYKASAEQGIRAAKGAGKPFCLVINVSDPHKPFYAEGRRGKTIDDPNVPSRVFKPAKVPVPGFLFDDLVVRKELSHYYSSVRRADDCVGGILEALKESGEEKRTVVVFLSDHGMPLPFAKTQMYHHSTRTPLIVRWPGITKPGSVDNIHMVSAVDFLPTLCDVVGIDQVEGVDGRSFEPLLRGEAQEDRGYIVKEYNENSGGIRNPMRAVQTPTYLYIFSPWSNGKRLMATATKGTSTYRRMNELAASDPAIAKRLDLFEHRVVEELYDVEQDPDCVTNLIDDPKHAKGLAELRKTLDAWMVKTADPMVDVFRERDSAEAREFYMAAVEKEAAERGPRVKARKDRKALRRRAAKLDADGLRRGNRRARVDQAAGGVIDAEDGDVVGVAAGDE
jgi:N-sulfoglucosamine sulfohydrolase